MLTQETTMPFQDAACAGAMNNRTVTMHAQFSTFAHQYRHTRKQVFDTQLDMLDC